MSVQELQQRIADLEQQLNAAAQQQGGATAAQPTTASSVIVHTRKEKIKKFKETDDVEEWIEEVEPCLSKFDTETLKVNFILENLDQRPKTEIRLNIDRSKATSSEVFDILREAYGVKETSIQLQQEFYTRKQQPTESIEDFSYALMDKAINLKKMKLKAFQKPNEILKEVLAEGVNDINLKRELRRLNTEQPTLTMHELMDRATKWDKDKEQQKELDVETCSQTSTMSTLLQAFQEQQEEIKKLSEAMQSRGRGQNRGRGYYRGQNRGNSWSRGQYRGNSRGRGQGRGHSWERGYDQGNNPPAQPSTWNGTGQQQPEAATPQQSPQMENANNGEVTRNNNCFYCNQPNHIQRFCLQKRRDERQQYQQSTNYSHSSLRNPSRVENLRIPQQHIRNKWTSTTLA